MKKPMKKVTLLLVLALILLVSFVVYNFYPVLIMNPVETGSVPDTNISAIKDNRNSVFFCQTDDGYLMFDAGSSAKSIEAALKDIGVSASEVKWVLLTHSDSDHVGALPLFPHAEVFMSEDELSMVDGTVNRNAFGKNRLPIDVGRLTLLRDGQELHLGGVEVECVKAAGHTNGSMVYVVDGKYLFAGDAFMVRDGKMGVHPFTMDAGGAEKMIEVLRDLVGDRGLDVFTAHYGYHKSAVFQ